MRNRRHSQSQCAAFEGRSAPWTALLLCLSDTLSPLREVAAIERAAAELLARFLGVSAVGFAEVASNGELVAGGYYDDACLGDPRCLCSPSAFSDVTRRDASFFVEDIAADEQRCGMLGTVTVGRVRAAAVARRAYGGLPAAYLYAFHAEPRPWCGEEREVIRAVGERTWSAVERVRTEDALRDADRRKNQFLAVLSHELRNPLTPIRNSLHVLERAAPGGEQARRAREIIGRQIDQLARLVDELLDVTRIARGKLRLERQRLELNELIENIVEDYRACFDTANIYLDWQPASVPLFIRADRTRIAQVVSNLLQNALKFTPPNGSVTIGAQRLHLQGQAVLRVSDTGVGMTAKLLERVFEPFVQADETLDRSKGGLGLGLALIKGLVEQHGGSIEAHSAGLRRGSEFVVRLPLDFEMANVLPLRTMRNDRAYRRVLVIEDNIDAADSLREVLELDGHEVAVAYDGHDGLSQAREFHPDLVLCDIGLPGMDGYAVASAFRADETLRMARLIALSGYAFPEDLQRAAEAGFDEHLAKPPTVENLESVLHSVTLQ